MTVSESQLIVDPGFPMHAYLHNRISSTGGGTRPDGDIVKVVFHSVDSTPSISAMTSGNLGQRGGLRVSYPYTQLSDACKPRKPGHRIFPGHAKPK